MIILRMQRIGLKGMINFLPRIYENELFYSVIARYRRMCGMISKRQLIEDLFGRYVVISSSYFPQYISFYIHCLPPTSKLSAREIILNHTMFPFYTAFISPEKTNFIYEVMHKGSNASKGNVEKLIGLGGSSVRKSRYLRYCPLCFKEDMEMFGESYWRRNHQIVGAFYCGKHEILLKDSSVLSTGSGLDFICPDEQVCDTNLLEEAYSNHIKKLNLKYVRNAELLLKSNFPRKELNYILSYYVDRLREKDLASKNGSLYLKDFQEQFLQFYPKQFLELMQSNFDTKNLSNWLRLFVRKNKGNRNPLRHLLLLQFLDVSPDKLFSNRRVIGKKSVNVQHSPNFDIKQRRKKWLNLIEENPGSNRSQLKEKGKGLHTWITKYDWDWYDKVTPKGRLGKGKAETKDWNKRDEECLKLAKEAVEAILQRGGKPIRITPTSIRKTLGFGTWFHNEKLIRTQRYLKQVREEIDEFRIRKIRWAINEMKSSGKSITPYKVQLYAGFDGSGKHIRKLVLLELSKFQ